jgi:hypothetical protein
MSDFILLNHVVEKNLGELPAEKHAIQLFHIHIKNH